MKKQGEKEKEGEREEEKERKESNLDTSELNCYAKN